MASRRNVPPPHDERFSVIERLAGDNQRLANSHLALRRNLVAAQEEAEKLREHIRSLRTEGDIQIRILLEKIVKMEADVRSGDGVKMEFQEAFCEAQSLAKSRSELTSQIQLATEELDNARADIKKLPDMRVELDNLKQEHQILRKTFEREKGTNVEKVEQMKNLEKDLIAMAEEVERLRVEVANAENRANAPIPNGDPYTNSASANLYPPPPHGNGGYVYNSFNEPHLHMVGGGAGLEISNFYPGGGFAVGPPVMNGPMGGSGFAVEPPPVMNGPVVHGGAGNPPAWGGAYDTLHVQR